MLCHSPIHALLESLIPVSLVGCSLGYIKGSCASQAPDDAADCILALMEESRNGPALEFSRKMRRGVGIVVYNAALNALCNLGCGARLTLVACCM